MFCENIEMNCTEALAWLESEPKSGERDVFIYQIHRYRHLLEK